MFFDDIFLLEDLHGVDLVVLGVPDEEHLRIRAFTNDGEGFIVLDASFLHG